MSSTVEDAHQCRDVHSVCQNGRARVYPDAADIDPRRGLFRPMPRVSFERTQARLA